MDKKTELKSALRELKDACGQVRFALTGLLVTLFRGD